MMNRDKRLTGSFPDLTTTQQTTTWAQQQVPQGKAYMQKQQIIQRKYMWCRSGLMAVW